MEWLDIVDEKGNPTGKTVGRTKAHREGILHRTSHVWLVRERQGNIELLLQRRSDEKDSYPGCYDISSAGHIPAGCGFLESALRELLEELGVEAEEEEFIFCGQRRICHDEYFHGELFKDRQISNVYYIWKDLEPEQFSIQKEELSGVRWMELRECMRKVCTNEMKHCIAVEELQMLVKTLKEREKTL